MNGYICQHWSLKYDFIKQTSVHVLSSEYLLVHTTRNSLKIKRVEFKIFRTILTRNLTLLFTFQNRQHVPVHFTASSFSSHSVAPGTKIKIANQPYPEFIDTSSHMTSRNQGSLSRKEREPWERGWRSRAWSSDVRFTFVYHYQVRCYKTTNT